MTTNSSTSKNSLIVHKEGEEGALTIDRLTGRITTPHEDRPDWAEGFATALLSERTDFYLKRLGDGKAYQDIADAAAIEASDLSWIGVNADGDEIEIEASNDYRMDLVANCLGMDRETGELSGEVLASHEIDRENGARSREEMAALEQSVTDGFGSQVQKQQQKQQNG